jgi:hypothetical protein
MMVDDEWITRIWNKTTVVISRYFPRIFRGELRKITKTASGELVIG